MFALSAINIYIQDTEYIIQFVLNMAFYATPILYLPSTLPELFQKVLNLNPMTHILDAYRNAFMYHTVPDIKIMLILVVMSVVVCFIGYKIFKKLEKGFAEQV